MMEQGAIEIIEKSLNLLKETNVNIVLENIFGMNEYKQKCTVIEICKKINNPHLRACIDVCHLHCMANIFKLDFDSLSEALQDYNILKLYNMTNANIITEISEENYNTRKDQVDEIKLLEKIREH